MKNSAAQSKRKYFVAAMIVIGCLALVVCGFVGFVVWAMTLRIGGGSQIGAAHLFVPGPFARHFAVSATIDVPRTPDILHSEASQQFNVYGSNPKREEFSAGFIRAERNGDRLSGFVYRKFGKLPAKVTTLAPIADGPHRATIDVNGDRIEFLIDGRQAYESSDAALGPVTYFTAGTLVGIDGEHAVGTISDLSILTAADGRARSISPSCIVTTHGLSIVRSADTWQFSGVNDSSVAREVTGCNPAQFPPGMLPSQKPTLSP